MSLTPSEKMQIQKNCPFIYLAYHFMQTSIMNQLQMLLPL